MAGKGWWRGEHIHVKKNGEEIIVESAVTALKDERGKPAGMLAVMRDVTERKHVEIDMIMKDRAIASSIAGIGFTDLQGVITYANDALLIMGGYKEEEVLGEDVQLFFVEENTETILNSIIEKGRWSGELKARRKDGSLFVVYLAAHLVKDKKGMPVCVMTSLTDMTEHKQFELLLQESEKKARQKAEELDTLMRLAPVGICISNDPQCRVIIGNEMANCLYEAEKNENISAGPAGGGYNDLTRRCFKNQRELKPSELPMQLSAATGKEIRDSELEVLLPSGNIITILGNASPLFDEKGKVRGAIAAFMDITERKKEREKIQELLIERSKQLKQSRYNFKMLVH
ncbi:MAG: PAS domain S-box protein, partial [Dehalococcoidia bacterium]